MQQAAIAAKRESCVPDKKQKTRNFSRKMLTKNGTKNQQLEECTMRISDNSEDSSLVFLPWICFQASASKINQNFQLAKQEVCHPNIGLCSW